MKKTITQRIDLEAESLFRRAHPDAGHGLWLCSKRVTRAYQKAAQRSLDAAIVFGNSSFGKASR